MVRTIERFERAGTYNAICPKCKDRYVAEGVKAGEIAVKRCSTCPPAVHHNSQIVTASHLNSARHSRRKAQVPLTGDRFAALPGEYQERRKSRRKKDEQQSH